MRTVTAKMKVRLASANVGVSADEAPRKRDKCSARKTS